MAEISNEQAEALKEKLQNMSPEELKEFQKERCIFCQIIGGKVASKKIYSDDKSTALLDINPANPGHMLLIPNEHYSIMPLMPADELKHLFMVAKALSQVSLKALETQGTNIFVANGLAAGQKAQHFMIHVIPRKEGDQLKLDIPEKTISSSDMKQIVERLGPAVAKAMGVKHIPKAAEEEPEEEIEESVEGQAEEEIEEIEKAKAKPRKKQAKKNAKKKPSKKAVKKKEEKEEPEESEGEGISLDDISNLITGAR